MQNIFDFLVNLLVLFVIISTAFYLLVYLGARFFTGVFSRSLVNEPNAIEIGATRAWRFVIILHFIIVICMVIVFPILERPNNPDWGHVIWYVLWSLPFLIIDVFILISLSSHSKASKANKKAAQEERDTQ